MLNTVFAISLTVVAGVSIIVQQALNANLRTAIGSAAWSGVVSYFVGLVAIAAFALVLREPLPSAAVIAGSPWWAWSGGVFGAIFISLAHPADPPAWRGDFHRAAGHRPDADVR